MKPMQNALPVERAIIDDDPFLAKRPRVQSEVTSINSKRSKELDDEMQTISDQIDKIEAEKVDMTKFGPAKDLEGAEFWNKQIQDILDERIDDLQGRFEKAEDAFNELNSN